MPDDVGPDEHGEDGDRRPVEWTLDIAILRN